MTATAATTGGSAATGGSSSSSSSAASGGRRALVWFAIAVATLVGVAVVGTPNEEGLPYSPSSNGELGTKGLKLLLERMGAEVVVTTDQPPADADIALVLPYQVPEDREPALREWAAAGHTLVVADERSGLAPNRGRAAALAGFDELVVERDRCTIGVLEGVESLEIDGGYRFEVAEGANGCFWMPGGGAFVVEQPVWPEGDDESAPGGQIVSLGSPTLLVNEHLDHDDNAALAVALLAPRPGIRVAILEEPLGSADEPRDMTELMSTGFKLAVLQGLLAFAVYAVFRGRRVGRPVLEPQPVLIGGSELVSAVGQLLAQTRSPGRAAAILRADLRRALCDRLGLPQGASPELVADTAVSRSGADPDRVRAAVTDHPVSSEAELLAVAGLVDEVRQEVLHGHAP